MSRSLADWLAYQQSTHPSAIALGLERVRVVADRLGLGRPAPCVITVAGTNGKGSTVAFIDAIARAAGLRVGAYTSPHLLRYNERVRIDGVDAEDAVLVAAFERIEAARGEVPLTYFEFGTLAALRVLADAGLDLAVLEVGLGGRLDAVNLVDADVSVLTTVALDHTDLLGPDRESIGREKAGVFRGGRLAVIADRDPPASVLAHAQAIGARVQRLGHDFDFVLHAEGFGYRDAQGTLELPMPALAAPSQPANASAAVRALRGVALPIPAAAFATGVACARNPGRLQQMPLRLDDGGEAELLLDVAHNPQAAAELGEWLRRHPCRGRTRAVFSALGDKDLPGLVAPLLAHVDAWHLAGLAGVARGLSVAALASRVAGSLAPRTVDTHAEVAGALQQARMASATGDRVLVYGSFHTVEAALHALGHGRA